jgi:hypothetical protein
MKTISPAAYLLAVFGFPTAATLTSCVDTYDTAPAVYSPLTTVSTYRPGYEVPALPAGYRTEVIRGARYYRHGDTYYRPQSGRYVVVEAPRQRPVQQETIIRRLPPGYRVTTHQGTRYYEIGDTYYRQRGAEYIAVERPY